MASSSTSSNEKSFKYDMFISFRGEDTRRTFVGHLYASLTRVGIHTFRDNEELEKGKQIDQLFKAIEESRFFIIVFSKNYAASSWCLKELTKIMECQDGNKQIAYPLFYDVEPTGIRHQTGKVGEAMVKHENVEQIKKWKEALEGGIRHQTGKVGEAMVKHENNEQTKKWREALKGATDLVGWKLKDMTNGNEADAIELIVEEISLKLHAIHLANDKLQKGKDRQMHDHKIPFEAIKYCTQGFDEKNIIGIGGYGKVYKGILTWANHFKKPVAVKCNVGRYQGIKEFRTEVTMLSEHQHENVITLIGFCDDNKEMILVYEYASHGSLDKYLRDGGLSWSQLLKICTGVASALDYLHNHVAKKHRIIHRDIKSSNVLLNENYDAKLSDFGLAKIGLANQQNTCVITNPCGTPGYWDPQYERTGVLTKESDVYSFGVVMFEVLCGRLACEYSYNDERVFLSHLARTRYRSGKLEEIIDHRIRKDSKERTLSKFSALAYRCIQETREERPPIAEVLLQLRESMKIQLEDEDDDGY